MKHTHKFLTTLVILSFLLGGLPVQPAHAATTWTVTKTVDVNDYVCDSDCSLREAVAAANAGDTVVFASSLAGSTITLSSQITIDKNLTIDGSSLGAHIRVSGGGSVRVFQVNNGITAIISHLDIINGMADSGGGILNYGETRVSNSAFSGNNVTHYGGGIFNYYSTLIMANSTFSGNNAFFGGGIANTGEAYIFNSTFSANEAHSGGGISGWDTKLEVANSTFSANSAINGGGIYIGGGTFRLRNSILANSTSGYDCYYYSGTLLQSFNNIIENNAPDPNNCSAPMYATDPMLGPLMNNGGSTQTHALLKDSQAIDHGDSDTCAGTLVVNFDQRGQPRLVDGDNNGTATCDIGAFEFQGTPGSQTLQSKGAYDGCVLESSETSNKGDTKNSRSKVFYVGDDNSNRQYRGILSFDTSGIPDWAVITKVTLNVKTAGLVGIDPFKSHNGLRVDIRNPYFGSTAALQTSDFQAKGSKNLAGKFSSKAVSKWYSADLSAASSYVNKTGLTQFRLRFYRDDNNDFGADYFKFYSGNAPAVSRPQLIVDYYVP